MSPSPDRAWLQGVGEGEIGYSRAITTIGRDYILRMHRALGGPAPPPVDHEGIAEAFVEKASVVWYCHEGEWLELSGMD
ncbi:MAG TPA: hypothetical protein VMM12_02770 [Longimicrobiales bacterium]|nr:hypothetical protein [Longimicrobiales bacterium]